MQQKKSPKFLDKLFDLLESEQYRFLRWSDDGKSFEVCDTEIQKKKGVSRNQRNKYLRYSINKSHLQVLQGLDDCLLLLGNQICMVLRDRKFEEISMFLLIVILFKERSMNTYNELINIISQNKLKVLEELSNQDNNLKHQIYEAEHQQLTETLKDLQNQQKQIQIKFNEQIHLQLQLKLRIIQMMNQINTHDITINIKAQHSYQLLCKVMQLIPNNEQHKEELAIIRSICKVFNEFHLESISSYLGSPNDRLTPLPFYLQDSSVSLEFGSKQSQNQFYELLQNQATKIFQPFQIKQQFMI